MILIILLLVQESQQEYGFEIEESSNYTNNTNEDECDINYS